MTSFNRQRKTAFWVAIVTFAAIAAVRAASPGETFTATATVKSPNGNASMPVRISINQFASDSERDAVVALVRAGDAAATRKGLASRKDVGYIELGTRKTPIKYAYIRPTGSGRLITVLTAAPLAFVGGAAPDAPSREGYDIALALLVLDANGTGDGELAPAAKVKINEEGAVVTDHYNGEAVRLTQIAKAK
ncbi:MAG TPA: hypothetical protein VL484_00835 [Vicinamibacterales bacterium]|jgi:hypothetical protein|nr:hypothetical protein [Vicinamibacterales bacterium]